MPTPHGITLKPPKQTYTAKARQPKEEVEEIDEDVLKVLNGDGEEEVAQGRLTKLGKPDRRFKGQRDIPEEQIINPKYIKPKTGGTLKDGTHITMVGKPDRRFRENRGKPEEQIMSEWAEQVYKQYARPTHH